MKFIKPFMFGIGLIIGFALMAEVKAAEVEVSLSWEVPITRTDGSALAVSEITEYRVYWGVDQSPQLSNVKVVNGVNDNFIIDLIPSIETYTLNFAVTAVADCGDGVTPAPCESAFSNIASKSFRVKSVAVPNAPAATVGTVRCLGECVITEQ